MIQGVKTKILRVIPDDRGRLAEMLRRDDAGFDTRFGQVYMTTAYPGVVKAWHYHRKQTDHFVCVSGMMQVGLYDAREDSPTKGETNTFFLGVHHPLLVEIPPMVYHGFKCVSDAEAIMIQYHDRALRSGESR
jgi:dTDP-4-dehydrorhamnose 3,5-epimerase